MPPRLFGQIADRASRQRQQIAEHSAKYRAEVRRQNAKWEFEQFLIAQRARIAAQLKQSSDRILGARWSSPNGESYYEVTRHGTTECSRGVRAEYVREQRHV